MVGEKNRGDISHFFPAVLGWLISAAVLVSVFSMLICKTSMDSSNIGYISSFISFASAVFAGAYSYRYVKGGVLVSSLITALFIVILLLTVGFLIQGNDITPAGVISVASFTFAGILLGSNMRSIFKNKGRKQINANIKKRKAK